MPGQLKGGTRRVAARFVIIVVNVVVFNAVTTSDCFSASIRIGGIKL